MDQRRDTGSSESSSTSKFSFGRNLIRRETSRLDVATEPPRGPLGLTTLYIPSNFVLSDLVFVHGLNGDSQNSWTKNGDFSLFWPREWLPEDQGFQHVRIHTFGYSSAVFGDGDVLNIPDFARNLLASIQDAPTIQGGERPPLVLVGHSMGGLVIKKAYILGRQIPEFQPLTSRIKGIFFLATPHQGADIAVTLKRILSLFPGKGQTSFVDDLSPQSPVLQSINDEFPRLCDSAETLQLFSFYETRPMNYGIGKGLIVEKHTAIMNYPRERRTYLDANHRDVARFSSRQDPSYITVRNALAAFVDGQRLKRSSLDEKLSLEEQEAVFKFLGSPETSDDDIAMQDSRRLQGSGEWFIHTDTFKKWRDAYSSTLFWVRGRPGAGKSFLAGKVLNSLREQNRDCCAFFFSAGDSSKGTMNALLRSMAYQMALIHPGILSTIKDLSRKNEIVDEADHNSVWRQLYLRDGLLKTKLDRQQYWVIDAMDECRGSSSSEMMNFLAKAQERWPLCILITSREAFEPSMTHRTEVLTDTMSDEDRNNDIALFLRTNLGLLPAPTQEAKEEMAGHITQRSRGCFLWANLMLQELRQVHTAYETQLVLASNPSDMDELYQKIVDDMTRARFGKSLAKAILIWTTTSFRPLSKEELHAAIQLDINDAVDDIGKSVLSCCGSLVFLDKRNRFQLIHKTARDFLMNPKQQSEFSVEKTAAHTRLAMACIQCLLDNDRKPPAKVLDPPKSSRLLGYASEYLFQHLFHVRSSDDKVFELLGKFFTSTSVMAWIEYIAANSDLQKVYHGGKTISNLLRRRSQHKPNIGHLQTEIENLEIWGNDLLHLVTKFSQRMKAAPSAIQRLIPPFCPPESIIRKQFCMRNRGLSVHGTSGRTWDECLTTISFEKGTKPLSTAAGISYFALGMNNGKIFIYDDTIFQEIHVFSHQEPVWMLKFGDTGKHLASCSHKSIRVWNLETWAEDHKFSLKSVPFVVSFVERDSILLVATKRNELLTFDLVMGGARDEPTNWTRDFEESGEGPPLHLKQPMLGDFSPHESLLAIIYRGEDILLWDTDQDRIHDIYEKDTGSRNNGSLKIADGSTTVRSLTFSSSPDKYLLAATYSDGDLIVYDTWSGDVQKILPQGNLMSLASSPDGRTLVGAGTYGDVILYDFDTLRCLYRLSIANNTMLSRYISFTADSQRIIDTRMTQCRVWQPTVLHREDADEENSDTVSISTGPKEVDYQVLESLAITTICCVKPPGAGLSIVFAGKEDGTAHVFDISGEPCSEQLFVQSAGFPIAELHFDDQSGLLTCRDRSNRVTCRQLMRFQGKRWRAGDPLLDSSMGITKITQVLGSGRNSRLLVSAEDKDALWSLKGQSESPLAQVEGHKSRRWIPHPNNPECLILAKRSVVELRSWTNLACIGTIPFPNTDAVFNSIHRIVSLNNSRYFATAAIDPLQGSKSDCRFHVWDFKDLHPGQQLLVPSLSLGPLSDSIEEVVGVYGERLVYIDIRYWVCSIDISEPLDVPVRHFFIPNDWLSIVRELVVDVAKGGEIIFVKQADLAVIKRGLEVTDTGVIFNPRRKTAAVLLTRRGLRPPTIGRPGPSALPGRAFQSQ